MTVLVFCSGFTLILYAAYNMRKRMSKNYKNNTKSVEEYEKMKNVAELSIFSMLIIHGLGMLFPITIVTTALSAQIAAIALLYSSIMTAIVINLTVKVYFTKEAKNNNQVPVVNHRQHNRRTI